MKALVAAALFAILSVHVGEPPTTRTPVLVELFTSEGCSSCPAADALLESLQREQPVDSAQVIPIGLHVDYFDHTGWKDAYSSPAYTSRQRTYSVQFGPDSVYTPQMVVDGREAVAGNDAKQVRRAIASAAARSHWPVVVTAQLADDRVQLRLELPPAPAGSEKVQVLAAITQDDLNTVVKGGENGGHTLHHIAVARRLQAIGFLSRQAALIEREVRIDRGWSRRGLKAIAWLQGATSRQVYGAAVAAIAE